MSVQRGAWRARANVFWMNFANEIVYAGALDDNGVPIYGNGANSRHRGVEVDASWDPSPLFGLDATLTLSRNTFTHYQRVRLRRNGDRVYDGNAPRRVPRRSGCAHRPHEPGPGAASLTGKRVGQFYLDNTEDNKDNPEARRQPGYVPLVNPAFTVFNFDAQGWLPDTWTGALGLPRIGLELRVNNLLEREVHSVRLRGRGAALYPGRHAQRLRRSDARIVIVRGHCRGASGFPLPRE